MKKNGCFIFLFCLIATQVLGQVDYNKQYFNAKQLFREGKYNLAMESFKALIPYDKNNPYSEYASFYYALSAYNKGFAAVAKDQFNEIKKLYPKWDHIDEVNFWLGKLYLDNRDYFQGWKVLSGIQDKKFKTDIEAARTKAIAGITDVETLKMMHEEFPKDEIIGRALVGNLAKNLANPEDKNLFESLVSSLNLKRTDYVPEAPKTFFKDIYSVSVLMPFMVNTLEPSAAKKRNQIVLDFYEGMKLALDTLTKQGISVSLRAYDTDRDPEKIKTVLATTELKSTDLIVGPFFQEENKVIQDFSQTNRINVINPFSNNSDLIGTNPYAFLFQPSFETLGRKSGEFLVNRAANRKKTCMVFYGTTRKDSILAANFSLAAREKGIRIMGSHRIARENVKAILNILATPTEYDEFKYPSQFTLRKDSVGSIFVASDDALLYSKVVSGVETRNDGIVLLGSSQWLEETVVDLEKYESLSIALMAPGYINTDTRPYAQFARKYIKVHGRTPSEYAKTGYEFMLFAGQQLKKNGVFFQEGLSSQGYIPGYLGEGFNFQFSRNNQLVPFITLENGMRKVIDKR